MKADLIKVCACFLFIGLLMMNNNSLADDVYLPSNEEVLTGIGISRIHVKGDYNFIPVFLDSNFDISKYFLKKGIHPPGVLDLVWEQEAAYAFTPHNDAEAANNFLIKFGFLPETSRWQPYFIGGVGTIYLTEHIPLQATQFNFNEYAGLGVQYFFNHRWAISAEYRFRHVSNADIKEPNDGVESNLFLVGISIKF